MPEGCIRHPQDPGVAICKGCERSICRACASFLPGGPFCSAKCMAAYEEDHGPLESKDFVLENVRARLEKFAEPKPSSEFPADPPQLDLPDPKPLHRRAPTARRVLKTPEPAAAAPAPARASVLRNRRARPSTGLQTTVTVLAILTGIAVVLLLTTHDPSPAAPGPEVAVRPRPEPAAVRPVPPRFDPPKLPPRLPEPAPPKPEPVKVEPPQPEPPKPEPPRPEPVRPEIPKPEPPKPEPKPEPVNLEPPKPEPPKPVEPPPKPAEPAPPPLPPIAKVRSISPWSGQKPGSWYRIKTTRAGKDVYSDVGLKDQADGSFVVVGQTYGADRSPEEETRHSVRVLMLIGQETLTIGGVSYPCGIYEPIENENPEKVWIAADGPHAGATLQVESPRSRTRAVKLERATFIVRNRSYPCSMIESTEEAGGTRAAVKTLFSAACPVGILKTEREDVTTVLVDCGDDWQRRPLFPPEEELALAQKALELGGQRIREAKPLFDELADLMEDLPSEKSDLQALVVKASKAETLLDEARALHLQAAPHLADRARIEERVRDLEGLRDSARVWKRRLEELLKEKK